MGGLGVLAVALCLYNTWVFNLLAGLVAALAVYEVLMATKYISNRVLALICITFAATVPFLRARYLITSLPEICFAFALSLFIVLLIEHDRLRIDQIGLSFFLAMCISFSINCLVLMRDQFGVAVGLFGLLLTFGSAWLSDTGAYFVGVLFGKHKLCPSISPKKTVEGLIGGLVSSIIGNLSLLWLLSWIYTIPFIVPYVGMGIRVNYLLIAILSPIFSLLGVLGDLSASIIKRQCGIKDFGNIMPGHGGVMDRFDSVLFVAPIVYICLQRLPLVYIIK